MASRKRKMLQKVRMKMQNNKEESAVSKLEISIKDPNAMVPDEKVTEFQSDVVYMCGMTRDEDKGGCKCNSLYLGKRVSPSTASGAIADSIVNVFREASQGDLLLEFQMLYNIYNTIDTRFDEILTLLKEKRRKNNGK